MTDYLNIEKQRGITVNTVSVSFNWRDQKFNIIDTPGHVEFQFEVKRCLAALDAVIIVLDSSKGIQAQTYSYFTYCKQFSLPCIFFCNKIDLTSNNLDKCFKDLSERLKLDFTYFDSETFSKLFSNSCTNKDLDFNDQENLQSFYETLSIMDPHFYSMYEKLRMKVICLHCLCFT